jgi:ABC-type dipeptide/oligopeptide/nickel transport system permease subunit
MKLPKAAPPGKAANWPLRVGLLLVAITILAAILGPHLAPHDPLERVSALQVGERWIGPPYPAATPGFPLGSDAAGRDLFSRLLWAVRPTLLLVAIVASVRLGIGLIIGLLAGWLRGAPGRLLDGLITGASAAPVLVVALAAIAFVGVQRGLVAFLFGLCLTGWAETARQVETRTRDVRVQNYIDAARSLGASEGRLLFNHTLRHILPLLGMLLAVEVSSVLMVTAGLGFLGYYIGGGVWVTVDDFVARSAAGMPELGQMLATSLEQILRPWPAVVVGSVVVSMILGFSLTGEGLRRRLQGETGGSPARSDVIFDWFSNRLADQRVRRGASPHPARRLLVGIVAAVALLAVGLAGWWISRSDQTPDNATAAFTVAPPGGHLWASARHDAYGTLTIDANGPLTVTVLWSFQAQSAFSGPPAVAADGTIYAATVDGIVHALGREGDLRWESALPAPAVGSPALAADGTIYVADHERGLSALAPDGAMLWRTTFGGRRPTSGPIVAPDGTIYFTQGDSIQAVAANGEALWQSPPIEGYAEEPPRLSGDGALIFLLTDAFAVTDGSPRPLLPPVEAAQIFLSPRYITGADGLGYRIVGASAVQWQATVDGATSMARIAWQLAGFDIFIPSDTGVTADGLFWLFYGSEYTDTRMVWVDRNSSLRKNLAMPLRASRLIGVDSRGNAYICASVATACYALGYGQDAPLWEVRLPPGGRNVTGSLTPDRLYLITDSGLLHAVGEKD